MTADPRPRPLRVLLVTPDYPPAHGGIQSLLHQIATALPNASVRVLTPDAPGGAAFDAAARVHGEHVHVERVPVPGRASFARVLAFNLRGLLHLRGWTPDVVLGGHVATSPLAVAAARAHRVPLVLYAYGKEVQGRPWLAAWALRRSAAAVAISDFTRGQLLATVGGRAHPPVHVVHPGVAIPADTDQRDRERASSSAPFTLITLGRLRDWYKGHDIVLEALPRVLERIPDARWIVLGEGRRREALEARAAELGVAHAVRFLGSVTDAEKDAWLRQADAFVMPARYPKGEVAGEGFAIVYLEAAAWGVPSIAGNVGGPLEAVVDGVTGLLVDPESVEQVADAIIELGTKPDLAIELGQQAKSRAEEEFTWPRIAAQLEAVLRGVADDASRVGNRP